MTHKNWMYGLLSGLHYSTTMRRRITVLSDHLAGAIPPGQSVLDVGSGSGLLAGALAARRPDLVIEGIDVKLPQDSAVRATPYDGERIPFDDDTWDLAMAVDVLHHSPDPEATLREMRRVARGYLLIKDHVADTRFDFQLLKGMDWLGNRGYGTALPYTYLSSAQWAQLFSDLGLEEVCRKQSLQIYAPPLRWLLDRQLHFLALLKTPEAGTRE